MKFSTVKNPNNLIQIDIKQRKAKAATLEIGQTQKLICSV